MTILSAASQDIPGGLLQFGLAGLFLFLFIMRKIRTEGEVKDRDAQIERLQETVSKYTEHYEKEVLPALIGATTAIATATKVSGDLLAFLNRHHDR